MKFQMASLVEKCAIVGIDLVEVAPDYEHIGMTGILSALLSMNMLGRIIHSREMKQG